MNAPKRPAFDITALPADVQRKLRNDMRGKGARAPRRQWPIDEVKRYAIRCLSVLADLTPEQRRRVLKHAAKLNDV